jgi:hypothetical protein
MTHKQKKIVAAFREAGATSGERATSAGTLAIHRGMAYRILRRQGVLREAGDDRLYLDESRWEALRARRRRVALAILGAVLITASLVMLWAAGR